VLLIAEYINYALDNAQARGDTTRTAGRQL
jgi:hypothetical protein